MSNFAAWQLVQCQWLGDVHNWERVAVIQPRFNAVDHYPFTVDPREQPLPGLFDACRDQGVAVAPYGPLAGGFLTGKYERGEGGRSAAPTAPGQTSAVRSARSPTGRRRCLRPSARWPTNSR